MKRLFVVALVVALALALALPATAGGPQGGSDRDEVQLSTQLATSFLSGIFVDVQQAGRFDRIIKSFGDVAGIITVQMSSGNGNVLQSNGRVSMLEGSSVDLAATTAVYSGGLGLSGNLMGVGLWLTAGPVVIDISQGPRTDLIYKAFGDACGIITVQMASGNANTLQSIGNVKVSFD